MTKKQKREELAQKRLEKLVQKGMMPCVHEDYINNEGLIYYSDVSGMLYWANDLGGLPDSVTEQIEKIETKYDTTIYHITHEFLEFGECWDLWCITDEDLEYGEDEFDNYNTTFAYVVNLSTPEFSEFGSIAFNIKGGGAVRTA